MECVTIPVLKQVLAALRWELAVLAATLKLSSYRACFLMHQPHYIELPFNPLPRVFLFIWYLCNSISLSAVKIINVAVSHVLYFDKQTKFHKWFWKLCFKSCVPQVSRQVYNLFQDLWNEFLGLFLSIERRKLGQNEGKTILCNVQMFLKFF